MSQSLSSPQTTTETGVREPSPARQAPENVIEVRGLRTQFGSFIVHDNLDLDVRQGEILGVVGGSGTGKSVLMRAIIGLKRPSKGTVKIFG
ncbi:MAG: ATP-binding cassette domain-containing protein, partial [Pseudomonadota bacterium]